MQEDTNTSRLFWFVSGILTILTVGWCLFLGYGNIERISLSLATCAAAFGIGSLIGFLFTIFGEELESFGKIRDAMIALISGVAGVSLAKLGQIRALAPVMNLG
jgi:hypothetical protein